MRISIEKIQSEPLKQALSFLCDKTQSYSLTDENNSNMYKIYTILISETTFTIYNGAEVGNHSPPLHL